MSNALGQFGKNLFSVGINYNIKGLGLERPNGMD